MSKKFLTDVIAQSADMPAARYSRTSWTVIRKPRMHGWPLRLAGSMLTIRV